MAGSGMEVDPPTTSVTVTTPNTNLKRSNSAPMINLLTAITTSSTCVSITASCSSSSGNQQFKPTESQRVRRFSTSGIGPHSPTTPVKISPRLDQIKHEEAVNVVNREAAHEREVQSAMQISQSWEELTLDEPMMTECKRPKSFTEQLHIFTSPCQYPGSPSPTRVGKQCFSPSLQQPVKTSALTPSPSPSPTRKTFRRSLSPIALRPSPLGLKRKMEMESGDKMESYFSPPKRLNPGCSTPEREKILPLSHPLIHSISSSSLEDSGSPEQQVPHVSVATSPQVPMTTSLMSTSSNPAHTPCFTFRPVNDLVDLHATDSEASDMTETTDISEHTEGSPLSGSHALSSLKHSPQV